MEKPDKLNRLKSAIKSANPELIDHALDEIKNQGDHTFVTPLIELLHQNLSREVKEKIFTLFVDLKNEDSVDQLVSDLKIENDLDILERLVAACWQNGLNFSKHLPYFVQLVIDQEFQIAFEAFTVIENMYGKIEGDIEVLLTDKIKACLPDAMENKEYLLRGLLDIIPNIPLDQDPVDF